MSSFTFITLISGAIVVLLVWKAISVVRSEASNVERGTEPGKGHTTIHAEYSSGLSGNSTSYDIPKDPQAYARRFVPPNAKEPK
ncbi:MAG: hypothetical protein MK180_12465 [Rhodobacteraceae bacterium]|nr:hypothetical protein [Paracoccaceae bacterium]